MAPRFRTEAGVAVPAVTAEQMREVDRLAVEEFGLGILQMMENAGRSLAHHAMKMVGEAVALGSAGTAGRRAALMAVLAGAGGNGGGGLCAARHLLNRGIPVAVVLDREPSALTGAAAAQMRVLDAAGMSPAPSDRAAEILAGAALLIDALIGYGLRGAASGRTAELVEIAGRSGRPVLALDVPSGLDATTGEAPGPVLQARRTLTLALPKTGLTAAPVGDLYLADIGIPPALYARLGLPYTPPFGDADSVRLMRDGDAVPAR